MVQAILQFLTDFWVMVGALAAVFSAIVFAVAACVAWFQLREAKIDRKARDRPFVVIDFHPEPSSIIKLRISNIGQTIARDVRFVVDPPFVTKQGSQRDLMKLGVFQTGIGSLAPGRVIEFLFDTWMKREGLPERHAVTITYKDDKDDPYTEHLDLDLGVFHSMEFIHQHGLNDIHEQVKKIAETLDGFTAWGGGLLALSPEDLVKRVEEEKFARQAETPSSASDPKPENGSNSSK